MKGVLILENGQKFYGNMLMDEPAVGEVVFNTGMTGYQETFTDPSYAGQIITLTYPIIGNYGLFHEIEQADRPYAAGFIVSELCEEPSNWQNEGKLSTFIMTHHIPCLYGVDTRAITRAIRSQGVMKGVIVPETMEESAIKELFDTPLETQLVRRVTTREIKHMGDGRFHVAVMDYGAKANILRELVNSALRLQEQQALQRSEQRMRELLEQQGMVLAGVTVGAGGNTGAGAGTQGQGSGAEGRSAGRPSGRAQVAVPAVESAPVRRTPAGPQPGVDLFV